VDELAYADQSADVDGLRVVEWRPADDARDPVVRRRELEHQLRVGARVVGLHEDRAATPAQRNSVSSSSGSNVRAIGRKSLLSQGYPERSRFQRCTWESTITGP
jgi:hypothetical protein